MIFIIKNIFFSSIFFCEKMQEYIILSRSGSNYEQCSEALTQTVNSYIKNLFIPSGNLVITAVQRPSGLNGTQNIFYFSQAMIRID